VAAARVQRWAVFLSMYDYVIKYKKGTKSGHADALSRLPIESSTEVQGEFLNFLTFGEGKIKLLKLEDIREETKNDNLLSQVYAALMGINKVSQSQVEIKYFLNRIEQFSCNDGCVYYGNRVVIPDSLKNNVLNILHDTHVGMVRMKMLARSYLWWRGIDLDIENFVKSCTTCAQTQNFTKNVKESSWIDSSYPYERIHIDFCNLDGLNFLVLVDSYSKWIEVSEMKNTSATHVIHRKNKVEKFNDSMPMNHYFSIV
jgi:hypothetical protein